MLVTVTVATVIMAEFSFRLIKQPLLPIKERFHFHWRLRGPRGSLTESFHASQSQNRNSREPLRELRAVWETGRHQERHGPHRKNPRARDDSDSFFL